MNMLKKNIEEVIQEMDFYTRKIADTERSSTWEVEYHNDLKKIKDKIIDIVSDLVSISKNKKYKSNQTQTQAMLKIARSLQNRFSRLANKYIEESTTSQGGATMSAGSGAQYGAKGSSKNMYYKMGFKDIPKYKPKSYDKKQLWEEDTTKSFQQDRENIFDTIENEINSLSSLISNAKNKTVEYYKQNPGSMAVVVSTDLVLDYIKDIKQLLKGEEE